MAALTGEEPELQLGATGEWVWTLQVRLYGLRILQEWPDGVYNSATENAVRALQSQVGMDNTGEVDHETWEALLHQEQQVGINYQFFNPWDALAQLRYDVEHGGQRDGWGNHFEDVAQGAPAYAGQISNDNQWVWDGNDWQPISGTAGAAEALSGETYHLGQVSPDGQWQWNGTDWVEAAAAHPATDSSAPDSYAGRLSPDGQWRWNGTDWEAASAPSDIDDYTGQLSPDGQWRWNGHDWQPA